MDGIGWEDMYILLTSFSSEGEGQNVAQVDLSTCIQSLIVGRNFQSDCVDIIFSIHLSQLRPKQVCLYQHRWKEIFLLNDALNTFYLRLYGVRHMVKDHSDSEKGNPLTPHRLLFPINSKGSFICTIPQTG